MVSGKPLSRSDLQGRWVFINYWAEWCKPCVAEIPEINRFAKQEGVRVRVLGVNYDGTVGRELSAQVDKMGIAFDVLVEDPAQRFGFERPQVLPATYVLDEQGRVSQVLLGPQTVASLRAVLPSATDSASKVLAEREGQ